MGWIGMRKLTLAVLGFTLVFVLSLPCPASSSTLQSITGSSAPRNNVIKIYMSEPSVNSGSLQWLNRLSPDNIRRRFAEISTRIDKEYTNFSWLNKIEYFDKLSLCRSGADEIQNTHKRLRNIERDIWHLREEAVSTQAYLYALLMKINFRESREHRAATRAHLRSSIEEELTSLHRLEANISVEMAKIARVRRDLQDIGALCR